jgi:hypothetical protein
MPVVCQQPFAQHSVQQVCHSLQLSSHWPKQDRSHTGHSNSTAGRRAARKKHHHKLTCSPGRATSCPCPSCHPSGHSPSCCRCRGRRSRHGRQTRRVRSLRRRGAGRGRVAEGNSELCFERNHWGEGPCVYCVLLNCLTCAVVDADLGVGLRCRVAGLVEEGCCRCRQPGCVVVCLLACVTHPSGCAWVH